MVQLSAAAEVERQSGPPGGRTVDAHARPLDMQLDTLEILEVHRRYADTRDPGLRAALVERYGGLAKALALKFHRDRDDIDDLIQVAMVGLLHAVDRFEPDRGVTFSTFAWATIVGELKRHRRDQRWNVHVSRRLYEAYLRTSVAVEELTHLLGRSPTVTEIAHKIGDSEEDIVAALEVRQAAQPLSIDSDDAGPELVDLADAIEHVDQRDNLRFLLSRLAPREREVVHLRFVEEMSQAQIAARVGLSQMHVSRLIAQSLGRLRALAAAG